MIQGLNITVTIQRVVDGPDDSVGGSTGTQVTISTGIKARISAVKPTVEMRIQGYETNRYFNGVLYPVTTDIREGDYIIPESGSHLGDTFHITGVQIDSLSPTDPRAHLSLRLERVEHNRILQ